ncbi:MAG: bile acid:sodium symporter family protein [Bacteroidota bacterium]
MENLFSDIFLPITIAIITLGMGLSLRLKDFKHIFLYPKSVIIGICSQMLLLPVIAFIIASLFNFDPLHKVGLIIISACPGGATSNLVTYLLRGNVALSISMTVINSIITLITIPAVVSLGLYYFTSQEANITLPVGSTILKVFLVTVLPAYAGVNLRHFFPNTSKKIEKYQRYILPILLLGIYSGVIFIDEGDRKTNIFDHLRVLPYPFLLNVATMFMGWMVARWTSLKKVNQFTISIEVGLQNSALAIFVAATLLESHAMAIVPVIYGSFSFFTTFLFGYGVKKILGNGRD